MRRIEKNARVWWVLQRRKVSAMAGYASMALNDVAKKIEPTLTQKERMALAWDKLEDQWERVVEPDEFQKIMAQQIKAHEERQAKLSAEAEAGADADPDAADAAQAAGVAPIYMGNPKSFVAPTNGTLQNAEMMNADGKMEPVPTRVDDHGNTWIKPPGSVEWVQVSTQAPQ